MLVARLLEKNAVTLTLPASQLHIRRSGGESQRHLRQKKRLSDFIFNADFLNVIG
jgi:hypothetical protein